MTSHIGRGFLVLAVVFLATGSTRIPAPAHSFALPHPLSYYKEGDAAFYNWLTGPDGPEMLGTTAPTWTRVCSGTLACERKKKHTMVDAGPAAEAIKLDVTQVPANGVIVAWMEQRGKFAEAKYGIPKEADSRVVMLVQDDGSGGAKWTTLLVWPTGYTPLKEGVFLKCDFVHDDKTSRAGFGGCPPNEDAATALHRQLQAIDDARDSKAQKAQAMQQLKTLLFDSSDDPLWVSCVGGCCIAETSITK